MTSTINLEVGSSMKCPSCIPPSSGLSLSLWPLPPKAEVEKISSGQTEVAAVRVAVADGVDMLVSCEAALSLFLQGGAAVHSENYVALFSDMFHWLLG